MKTSDLKMIANRISLLPFQERRLQVFRLLRDLNKYHEREAEKRIREYVI